MNSGDEARDLYPVFLDLRGRTVLVVGGGAVAEEKIESLFGTGARISVISPVPSQRILAWSEDRKISLHRRTYEVGDLVGAFLVLAERSDPSLERELFAEAEQRRIFANVQDRLARCSFHAPAVVRKGPLRISISTGGIAPALASRLRRRLDRELGPEYSLLLEMLRPIREPLAAAVPEFAERRRRWYRLVDSDVLDRLRAGDRSGAERIVTKCLGVRPPEGREAIDAGRRQQ